MKLATVEFYLVEQSPEIAGIPDGEPVEPVKYVECRLVYPPNEFAAGIGVSISEAFENLRDRVLDAAVFSTLQIYNQGPEQEQDREPEQEPDKA